MILAFIDDGTITVYDSLLQIIIDCEEPDVADGVYTFTDERGYLLRPSFNQPRTIFSFGPIHLTASGGFSLEPTEERNKRLLLDVLQDHVLVNKGPTSINDSQQLKSLLLKSNPELESELL